jgi:hypothetical protein
MSPTVLLKKFKEVNEAKSLSSNRKDGNGPLFS